MSIHNPAHLGLSIRTRGKDEIEIRPSLFGGYFRGLLRTLILGGLCVIWGMDRHYGEQPFLSIYQSLYEDYIWTFHPEIEMMPMYENHVRIRSDPELLAKVPNLKIDPYDEYENEYIQKYHRWDFLGLIWAAIWIPGLLFLFFLPGARGLRLNRKERLIYLQGIFGHQFVPVPERGDPLSGITYDRFSLYMFGWGRRFSLMINSAVPEKAPVSGWFGVYPTPSAEHNADLVRAMRAYFSEENPEFLNHVGRFYKIPWLHPLIFLCNGFAPAFIFSRRKANRAIAQFKQQWNRLSVFEQGVYFDKGRHAQKTLNEDLKSAGHFNSVED